MRMLAGYVKVKIHEGIFSGNEEIKDSSSNKLTESIDACDPPKIPHYKSGNLLEISFIYDCTTPGLITEGILAEPSVCVSAYTIRRFVRQNFT